MFKNISFCLIFLLLTSCASTTSLQSHDVYYKSTLKVNEAYELRGGLLTLGYVIPAGRYKALLQDNKGIYFSSSTPLIAQDPLLGSLYRTGGLYYNMTKNQVYYYVFNTRGFGEMHMGQALPGLDYQIIHEK